MLKYITGDLFSHDFKNATTPIIIAHCVNNRRAMGSGFVVPLMKRWPIVPQRYHQEPNLFLGDVGYVKVEDTLGGGVFVANMVGQNNTISPNNPKPIKYSAILKCMENVARHAKSLKAKIIAPKFCSKRAGGSWELIEELIEEIWADLDVTIYQYDENLPNA